MRADSFYAVGMIASSGRYCKVPRRRGKKSMVGVSLRLAILILPGTGTVELKHGHAWQTGYSRVSAS